MTAEALNTITSPTNTRIRVTVNSQPSTLTPFAMGDLFHHGGARARRTMSMNFEPAITILVRAGSAKLMLSFRSQPSYCFLEHPSAVLIILELVEAGARGSQQHNISCFGCRRRTFQRSLECPRVVNFRRRLDLRLDFFRRGTDRVDALHPLPQQVAEQRVIAVFVLAAKNEVDIRRERLQRFDRGVHVSRLGVVVVLDAANRGHV